MWWNPIQSRVIADALRNRMQNREDSSPQQQQQHLQQPQQEQRPIDSGKVSESSALQVDEVVNPKKDIETQNFAIEILSSVITVP